MTHKKTLTIILLIAGALLVLLLVGALCRASYRHRRSTRLYDEGMKAFQQGQYDEAYQSLRSYLVSDPNHEGAWKMLAEIEEGRGHWFQAAAAWQRLSRLNVLEEDYVRKYVKASYRSHDYQYLFTFFDKCDSKWLGEFQEIRALVAFKVEPDDEKTAALVDALPPESATGRLIHVLKDRGPAEEITKLENAADPVLQVEAFILDGFLAEFQDKDLKRAETCLERAAALDPFICQGEYGDFLFRSKRYKEAYEAYSCKENVLLSVASFLNYAETAYAMENGEALEQIGKRLNGTYPKMIHELAYVHALKAHLDGNVELMKSNYTVAKQLQRRTPMAMQLNFALAIVNNDVPLLAQALKFLATSPTFAENREKILQQITPVLQANASGDNLGIAAQMAGLFMELEPPNDLVWRIVVLDKWRQKSLKPELLNKAIELFPKEQTFRQLALLQARGDESATNLAFDQLIAVSKNPSVERFRKASFLQQNGKADEAAMEIVKMTENDTSLLASKLCLIHGLRSGNRTVLEQAGKCDHLKPIAAFEIERLFGDKDEATRMLHDTRMEDAFSAKQTEDRPILLSLAIFLAVIHDVDRSIAVYEQLKPYSTGDATVELNLSELYASKGEKEKGLENAKSAMSRFPELPLARMIYGLRCAESAEFEEAIANIPDTIEDKRLKGALVYSLEKLIEESFEGGHHFTAREQLDRLRKVSPDSPVIEEYVKKFADQGIKVGK